jgi:hypothetical protein
MSLPVETVFYLKNGVTLDKKVIYQRVNSQERVVD